MNPGRVRLAVGGLCGIVVVWSLIGLTVGLDTSIWVIRVLTFSSGFTSGFAVIAVQASSFATISSADAGRASALFQTQTQVAGGFGVALLVTVVAPVAPAGATGAALVPAFHHALLTAASMSAIGAVIALTIRDTDAIATMRRPEPIPAAAPPRIGEGTAGASFEEMAARLRQSRISAFPVIDDDGKVIGVVSEADLLARKVLDAGHAGTGADMPHPGTPEKADDLTAGDLMSHPAATVSPEDSVEVATRLMYTLQVKRLPVIDRSGRLAGIISRTDVLAVFDRSDEEIRKEIVNDVIWQEFGATSSQFAVTVQAGVVTLEGNAETTTLSHVIMRKVRHIPGVVAVRDRLSYPDADVGITGPGF